MSAKEYGYLTTDFEYLGWRTWRFEQDKKSVIDVVSHEKFNCQSDSYWVDEPSFFCNNPECRCWYFCDFCGNEKLMRTMTIANVLLKEKPEEENSKIRPVRLILCNECWNQTNDYVESNSLPDFKYPEE